MKRSFAALLTMTGFFFILSFCAATQFRVTHVAVDGNAVRETFSIGEEVLLHLGGAFIGAVITKIGKSAFTARFKGGGTGSFNKQKAHKMPAHDPDDN